MDIIPVVDLMNGQVVHAKHGDRVNYRPIQSSLCASSAPLDIVKSLLELYPFKRLYIADINAIQRRGNHTHIIQQIMDRYPSLELWLDAAINETESAASWQQQGIQCVIGSESMIGLDDYQAIQKALKNDFALSLDFHTQHCLGPAELFTNVALWPDRVIAMTLDLVGSASGPDTDKLYQLRSKHPQIYAAGGVRHFDDLRALVKAGVAGVLVATLLHTGKLTASQIDDMSST
ncbi:MAG: HisA/HisF-related TIM barrel protein [Nitrosomonadales bacterium]|nr:HisA/HisF-related TIM barrel protein [Nitrosomonadales bacterium]